MTKAVKRLLILSAVVALALQADVPDCKTKAFDDGTAILACSRSDGCLWNFSLFDRAHWNGCFPAFIYVAQPTTMLPGYGISVTFVPLYSDSTEADFVIETHPATGAHTIIERKGIQVVHLDGQPVNTASVTTGSLYDPGVPTVRATERGGSHGAVLHIYE